MEEEEENEDNLEKGTKRKENYDEEEEECNIEGVTRTNIK